MAGRILIAYATQHGSTAEIAQAVGKELTAAGFGVEVAELKNVRSLQEYDGIVIGAPLYMGGLMKDVAQFVGRYRTELSLLPVASFAVGLTPVSKNAGNVDHAMECLHTSLSPVKPVGTILFAGRLDPAGLGFIQRKMMELGKVPPGDFRDWDLIAAWAREIPGKMGLFAGTKD